MVPAGYEPATSAVSRRRSSPELRDRGAYKHQMLLISTLPVLLLIGNTLKEDGVGFEPTERGVAIRWVKPLPYPSTVVHCFTCPRVESNDFLRFFRPAYGPPIPPEAFFTSYRPGGSRTRVPRLPFQPFIRRRGYRPLLPTKARRDSNSHFLGLGNRVPIQLATGLHAPSRSRTCTSLGQRVLRPPRLTNSAISAHTPRRTRTSNRRGRSPLLFQLS